MRRRPRPLPVLLGLATVAVVAAHSTGLVLPTSAEPSPLPIQRYTASYYFWLLVNQLCMLAIPVFFFISGYFVGYAARGQPPTLSWKVVQHRLAGILGPYLFWSLVVYLLQSAQGEGSPPLTFLQELLRRMVFPRVFDLFFFIPVLCQFYLLSLHTTRFAKERPGLLLTTAASLQMLTLVLFYLRIYGAAVPGWVRFIVDNEVATFAKWAIFFPLGTVAFFHRGRFKQAWGRFQRRLGVVVATLGVLSVVESEIALETIGYGRWARDQTKLSSVLFGLAFILLFVVVDRISLPGAPSLEQVGKRSLGVYLLHGHLLLRLVPAINNYLPWLYDHQLVFQPLVIGTGVGMSLLLMMMVARSPARGYYRQLFG